MVYDGAAVKAGDLVLRLANRHRMWIDAQVHEQQMSLISDGQPVRATVVSQPGRTFTGKVLFVHPHVDPQTRTALARIEIDNADMTLRQGMYATVEIAADAYREATVVPREAVIDTGRRQLVFVATGGGRFVPRDVRLGLPGENDTVEVLDGLQPADEVVTSGQFLLDSESRLKEAVAKHLSVGLAGHGNTAAQAADPTGAGDAAKGTRTAFTAAPASTQGRGATSQPAELATIPHADDIVREYLVLAEKFGARQEKEEPADVAPLVKAASMAAEHSEGDAAKALAGKVAEAAKPLVGKPIAEQRKAFVALSEAAIALARGARLTQQASETLFVMHCPMAFDDAGGNWLQNKETIQNPYYAKEMKRCGEVTDRIALRK
jgi:Cu(I)/Ag(I) efflux system membrane fusion protein